MENPARGLAEQGHFGGIASERRGVVPHPERGRSALILEPVHARRGVRGVLRGERAVRELAQRAEAVKLSVTMTAPVASESDRPSYDASAPLPNMKPPPWIHTITGAGAAGLAAGVHTLTVRQSSLVPAIGAVESAGICGQNAPFLVGVARRLPRRAGGLRRLPAQRPHRRRGVGDAEVGARLADSPHPRTGPLSVSTTSGWAAAPPEPHRRVGSTLPPEPEPQPAAGRTARASPPRRQAFQLSISGRDWAQASHFPLDTSCSGCDRRRRSAVDRCLGDIGQPGRRVECPALARTKWRHLRGCAGLPDVGWATSSLLVEPLPS